MIHHVWIDEDEDREGSRYQAVCKDCPWSSRWVYADNYEDIQDGDHVITPEDQAMGQAKERGNQHAEEPE